ncbi:MAG: hypothetical protein ACT4OH_06355 [Methylophilaceae bacterium]
MNKFLLALLTMLFVVGCASSGGTSAADDNGGLPEIAAYEDEAYEALPDDVPADAS